MKLLYNHGTDILQILSADVSADLVASCVVRHNQQTEERNKRKLHDPGEVVYAMTGNQYERIPYMSGEFPAGMWEVGYPRPRSDDYKAPFYIPTNAYKLVPVWTLDKNGGYDRPTSRLVTDWGYGLHFSTSRTTLGCIKIHDKDKLLFLVGLIKDEIKKERIVRLVVS